VTLENRGQVHGSDLRRMVAKEGEPSLRRGGGSLSPVLRYARLSDFEVELQRFVMDTWNAPQRIVDTHPPDQRAQIHIDLWATTYRSRLPTRVTSKPARCRRTSVSSRRWEPTIEPNEEQPIAIGKANARQILHSKMIN
jgi:hypothetical protein